ncbi:MAG: hypothetical protein ABGZ17_32045 [Planctomycetaceae bacterium]
MAARTMLMVIGLLLLSARETDAVEIPAEHHPWSRFQPGSWQSVRVTTESFGADQAKSVDIKIITTRLIKTETDGFVLAREAKVGDRISKQETHKYAWDGSTTNTTTRTRYSLGEVLIEGKTFACQTHLLTTRTDGTTTVTKSWYCPDHAPYFLKRLTRVTGQRRQTTLTTVINRLVKQRALNREFDCWKSEIRDATPGTTTETTSYHSLQVPGGLVTSMAQINDRQQGRKATVKMELIAYEISR